MSDKNPTADDKRRIDTIRKFVALGGFANPDAPAPEKGCPTCRDGHSPGQGAATCFKPFKGMAGMLHIAAALKSGCCDIVNTPTSSDIIPVAADVVNAWSAGAGAHPGVPTSVNVTGGSGTISAPDDDRLVKVPALLFNFSVPDNTGDADVSISWGGKQEFGSSLGKSGYLARIGQGQSSIVIPIVGTVNGRDYATLAVLGSATAMARIYPSGAGQFGAAASTVSITVTGLPSGATAAVRPLVPGDSAYEDVLEALAVQLA